MTGRIRLPRGGSSRVQATRGCGRGNAADRELRFPHDNMLSILPMALITATHTVRPGRTQPTLKSRLVTYQEPSILLDSTLMSS